MTKQFPIKRMTNLAMTKVNWGLNLSSTVPHDSPPYSLFPISPFLYLPISLLSLFLSPSLPLSHSSLSPPLSHSLSLFLPLCSLSLSKWPESRYVSWPWLDDQKTGRSISNTNYDSLSPTNRDLPPGQTTLHSSPLVILCSLQAHLTTLTQTNNSLSVSIKGEVLRGWDVFKLWRCNEGNEERKIGGNKNESLTQGI